MIIGTYTPSALGTLEQSPYTFYLGGSRLMEQMWREKYDDCDPMVQGDCPSFSIHTTQETDYDLYATYDPMVESFLLSAGFELSSANDYYLDTECVVIYGKENVQVVLRKDAEFYKTVFENINLEVYYHYMWKSSPRKPDRFLIGRIFNMLFAIAHATEGV